MEKEKEMKESIGMLFSTTTASLVSENEAIEYVILHRAPKSKEFSNEQFILTLDKRKWQLQNQYFGVPYGTLVEVYHRKSL
jgi:hypothetical protein